MTIKHKVTRDEQTQKTKYVKKKHKKSKNTSTALAIIDKQIIKPNNPNELLPKPKLVSALFVCKNDFESAIKGEFKLTSKHIDQLSGVINTTQVELKQALLIVYNNKCYEALGYSDFKAYVEANFTITYDAALKQVWAAKVAYVVNGVDAIGFFSDNSMLAMRGLSDKQIEDVVDQIESEHGDDVTINGKYTRKIVEAAMSKLKLLDILEVDNEEVHVLEVGNEEEDLLEADNEEVDVAEQEDYLDSDAKAKISTKQSSKSKQSNTTQVEQSNSHRQFLKQFNIKAEKSKSSKVIFTAFINTDSGNNLNTVTKAIELLCSHAIVLAKSHVTNTLKKMEDLDE